ncbi:MAG: hypothetical protein NTU95_11235 [Methanothrix sp.]|nr:hypothetical protein [Methanothrix sp.]
MSVKIFSKCGITLILFPFILALFCLTGCLEKAGDITQTPSTMPEGQPAMQMDFDAELRNDLFSVRGDLMLSGNSSLAYLMLNATLCQGEREQLNTKYLLMQIEPNRDYSFEIAKNVKIPAGEYDCAIEAKGPQGVLAMESRRVSLEKSGQERAFEQVPWPVDLDEEFSKQKLDEERPVEESISTKETQDAPEEIGGKESVAGVASSSTLSNEAKATFMGSITSKKYHRMDCRYALKIKPENRIYFQNMEDAKRQGYLPCKSCNP